MSAPDETHKLDFPDGFVERLRTVIPAGEDPLLDSAIRRRQFLIVFRQLHSHKDVRRPATIWEQLAKELIYLTVFPGKCSDDTAHLLSEIAQKAEITRLYTELHAMLYGRTS